MKQSLLGKKVVIEERMYGTWRVEREGGTVIKETDEKYCVRKFIGKYGPFDDWIPKENYYRRCVELREARVK